MDYKHKCQERPAESSGQRLLYCMQLLHIHAFMTDAERKKIHNRLSKWAGRAIAKGKKGTK